MMMMTAVASVAGIASLMALMVHDSRGAAERGAVASMESVLCSRSGCDIETGLTEG